MWTRYRIVRDLHIPICGKQTKPLFFFLLLFYRGREENVSGIKFFILKAIIQIMCAGRRIEMNMCAIGYLNRLGQYMYVCMIIGFCMAITIYRYITNKTNKEEIESQCRKWQKYTYIHKSVTIAINTSLYVWLHLIIDAMKLYMHIQWG